MMSLSFIMGLCLNLTLLLDKYCLISMRLCGGKYCTAFSFFMLESPALKAKGFGGILGGELRPPTPPPNPEVLSEGGFELLPGFGKGRLLTV